MKSKTAVTKRFKLTAKGKILRKGGLSSHRQLHKSSRRQRSQNEPKLVAKADEKKIKRLLLR